jgi:hypothetical protein
MSDDASSDQMRELEMLRHEYKAAMSVATDPDEKWRLYRILQELNLCIERLVQQRENASLDATKAHDLRSCFDAKAQADLKRRC